MQFQLLKAGLAPVMMFTRQELALRHRGTALGVFWLFAQPLALVLIFSIVFSELMGARLAAGGGKYAYSAYLIGGLLIWNAQASVLMQMSLIYQTKAALLTKTRLSLVLMPLYVVLAEGVLWAAGMSVFGVFIWATGQGSLLGLWQVPLVAALTFAAAYGAGLILAMLGVFLPDLRTGLPVVLQIWFWATPIVYVVDVLPIWLRDAQAWNPLYWGPAKIQDLVMGRGGLTILATLQAVIGIALLFAAVSLLQRRLERDIRDLI